MPIPKINEIRVFEDKVQVKKGVFTVTVQPVDGKTIDDCVARGHELMRDAGIASYETKDMRDSAASN